MYQSPSRSKIAVNSLCALQAFYDTVVGQSLSNDSPTVRLARTSGGTVVYLVRVADTRRSRHRFFGSPRSRRGAPPAQRTDGVDRASIEPLGLLRDGRHVVTVTRQRRSDNCEQRERMRRSSPRSADHGGSTARVFQRAGMQTEGRLEVRHPVPQNECWSVGSDQVRCASDLVAR